MSMAVPIILASRHVSNYSLGRDFGIVESQLGGTQNLSGENVGATRVDIRVVMKQQSLGDPSRRGDGIAAIASSDNVGCHAILTFLTKTEILALCQI